MKRIRLLLCVFCVLLMFLCCSCGLFGDQRYICDADEVFSVQIVSLDKYVVGEYRFEYTVLSEISDYAAFVDQINDLKHSVNWGEPSQLYEGYTVIRIDYQNGDYDLLYPNAQWFHRSGINQDGYFFFDRPQFDALVSEYLAETSWHRTIGLYGTRICQYHHHQRRGHCQCVRKARPH